MDKQMGIEAYTQDLDTKLSDTQIRENLRVNKMEKTKGKQPEYRVAQSQSRMNADDATFKQVLWNVGAIFRTEGNKWGDLVIGELRLLIFENKKHGEKDAPYRVVSPEKNKEGKAVFKNVGVLYTSDSEKKFGDLILGDLRLPVFVNKPK